MFYIVVSKTNNNLKCVKVIIKQNFRGRTQQGKPIFLEYVKVINITF